MSSHRLRQILFLLLLAVGLIHWFQTDTLKSLNNFQISGLLAAFIIALIPTFRRGVDRSIHWCNATLRPHPVWPAIAVSLLAAIYLLILAHVAGDFLYLKLNDEHAYMIQARMLAHGRLWLPPYPPDIAPFFDSISLISDRVYASMYFPGTALAMVPFIWLHLPFWLMPLLAASLAAGLLYLLAAELFDPFPGLLAVLILLSLHIFRQTSLLLLSESPFLAAELVLLLAWFRFRHQPRMRWAFIFGLAAGYAAITRPLDAICFVLPVGLAILIQLRSQQKKLLGSLTAISLAAAPFLLLLLIQNIGITGHYYELAEGYYNQHNFPAPPMGFHKVHPHFIPADISPPKKQWLHDWVLPWFQVHTPTNALRSWYGNRFRQALDNSLPSPLFNILLPLAILSLRDTRRLAMTVALFLFLIGYAIYLFFLEHYVISILPSMICLVLMGWQSIRLAWPNAKPISTFVLLCVAALSLAALPPIAPFSPHDPKSAPDQFAANLAISRLPKTPAVVLFRFDPMVGSFHDDPVYNDSVAWPDDALVIRARDLGADENRKIVRYYAEHQPNRIFYIYDPDARAAGQNPLSPPLGTAKELNLTGKVP